MAAIDVSIEIPPVGFQLFHFNIWGVPSQPSDLKYGISETWIRFVELVQIVDAPNHNTLKIIQVLDQLYKPDPHFRNAML
jgi:hypothetical protein